MNIIDLIFFVVLIWAAYMGFKKGLIIELTTFIAMALGIYGAIHFSDIVAEKLQENIDSQYLPITSFALTFLIVVILVFAIGKIVEKLFNMMAMKMLNKVLGALFSILKVGVVMLSVVLIMDGMDQKVKFLPEDIKSDSLVYNTLLDISKGILPAQGVQNIISNPINILDSSDTTNINN